jgi:hypothetical protein
MVNKTFIRCEISPDYSGLFYYLNEMEIDSETIRLFTSGMATVNGQNYDCKEFATNDETKRILCVKYPDERIYETYYNPFKEEFRKALNRILPPF